MALLVLYLLCVLGPEAACKKRRGSCMVCLLRRVSTCQWCLLHIIVQQDLHWQCADILCIRVRRHYMTLQQESTYERFTLWLPCVVLMHGIA